MQVLNKNCVILVVSVLTSLIGCGSDPVTPDTSGNETPPVSDLLTDAQMRTRQDILAQPVDLEYITWLSANAQPIRSLYSTDYSDLEFLKTTIGDKRIVCLGESGHGVREFSEAKVRLIQFLHQEMDFGVIIFESSLYDCYRANARIGTAEPIESMQASIHGVWQTEALLTLFEYLKEVRSSDSPLQLAGLQLSESALRPGEPQSDFLHDLIDPVDSTYADAVKTFDEVVMTKLRLNVLNRRHWAETQGDAYKEYYNQLVTFIETNRAAMEAASSLADVVIAERLAYSMAARITLILAAGNELMEIPETTNADNIAALYEEIFPGQKVIVWAHNLHLRYDQPAVVSAQQPDSRTLGWWLAQSYGTVSYNIGLYMYRGEAASNFGSTYDIAPASPGSLESIFYKARLKHLFVDMLGQEQNAGNAWMFSNIPVKSWGQYDINLVPRDQNDGILFIDTVQAPLFIPVETP